MSKDEILLQWEFYSNEYRKKPTKRLLKKIKSLEDEWGLYSSITEVKNGNNKN